MVYNGMDYISLIIGIFLGLIIYQAFTFACALFGRKHHYQERAITQTIYPNGGTLSLNASVELEAHRRYFRSIYSYIGSYPAWKAQQEFRELILSLNPPAKHCKYHFHNIDAYFGKVVDETNKLRHFHDHQISNGHGWEDGLLRQARGDLLLPEIIEKHTDFIKYTESK